MFVFVFARGCSGLSAARPALAPLFQCRHDTGVADVGA